MVKILHSALILISSSGILFIFHNFRFTAKITSTLINSSRKIKTPNLLSVPLIKIPQKKLQKVTNNRTSVIILVTSSRENFDQRKIIRETWVKNSNHSGSVFFIVGNGFCNFIAKDYQESKGKLLSCNQTEIYESRTKIRPDLAQNLTEDQLDHATFGFDNLLQAEFYQESENASKNEQIVHEYQNHQKQISDQITKEMEKYQDLVLIDVIDTYRNLSRKIIGGFFWAEKYVTENTRFILKADDDSYVKIDQLNEYLTNLYDNNPKIHDMAYLSSYKHTKLYEKLFENKVPGRNFGKSLSNSLAHGSLQHLQEEVSPKNDLVKKMLSLQRLDKSSLLDRNNSNSYFYLGWRQKWNVVMKEGKWADLDYQKYRYPLYMNGCSSYVISLNLLKKLKSTNKPLFNYVNEDTNIGIWIDELLSEDEHDKIKIFKPLGWGQCKVAVCESSYRLVIGHNLYGEKMRACHQAVLNNP